LDNKQVATGARIPKKFMADDMDLAEDDDDDDDANSDFDVEDERKDSHEKKINLSVINRAGAVKE
jgi:hypothetical protein